MTDLAQRVFVPTVGEAGRQVAQLRHVLGLIHQLAGREPAPAGDAALDQGARISLAYDTALPVVQRRFDACAGEIATWAAAGVEALLAAEKASPAVAVHLAAELDQAIHELGRILRL